MIEQLASCLVYQLYIVCMRNLRNLKIAHYSCTILRLECNLGILRMRNAISRLRKFSDCVQHTMYTLYVCFILKPRCLVPCLHSLSFTSPSHFHSCACPLSPHLVPFLPSSLTCPSIFTILALMLFLPTCPDLLSSLPSPHSSLLTLVSSLSSPIFFSPHSHPFSFTDLFKISFLFLVSAQ